MIFRCLERYRELKKHRRRQKIQKTLALMGSTQRGPNSFLVLQNGARVLCVMM